MNPQERFHAQIKASAQKAEEKHQEFLESQKPWWKKVVKAIKSAFGK